MRRKRLRGVHDWLRGLALYLWIYHPEEASTNSEMEANDALIPSVSISWASVGSGNEVNLHERERRVIMWVTSEIVPSRRIPTKLDSKRASSPTLLWV